MRTKQSVGQAISIALRGMFLLFHERSFRIQIIIGIIVTALGFHFDIESWAWLAQNIAIGLVLMAEGINTAIECLADVVQPKYDEKIGRIKDMSAGFVSIAALTAFVIAAIIYAPKLGLV